ncbi:MAG: hypothetical protein ACJASQ_003217 [Crocinitomicaceae bacterium]|jgi:hypothetical protein
MAGLYRVKIAFYVKKMMISRSNFSTGHTELTKSV